MSSLRQRVAAGLGANAFGQAVNVGIQLFSLPLFLSQWDAATYGTWLMLSALPAYLSMADVGMVTAAGNRMTMALGRHDVVEANRVFHSSLVFMAVVCTSLALVVFPLIAFAPTSLLSNTDQRTALALLSATVLLMLFSGLADSIFRSTGRYASGTMLGNLLRLGEWAGSIAGLLLVGSFTAVAMGALIVRAVGLTALVQLSRSGSQGISWGREHASTHEVKAMLKPALSFMVFPLSNALSFQGVTLLVGHFFGPASVALFNTYRTLARVAVQVTSTFSHALWPEFARLFGMGGADAVRGLYLRSAALGAVTAIGLSLAVYLAGPWILSTWTHNAIDFRPEIMLLMLGYATVGGLWHVPRVLLMATNQHVSLASWALVAAVLVVTLSVATAGTWGLPAIVMSMLVSEISIAVACLWLAQTMLARNAAPA